MPTSAGSGSSGAPAETPGRLDSPGRQQIDSKGSSLLHGAVVSGDVEVVASLLTSPDYDVNERNRAGQTALTVALGSNHTALVELCV